MAEGVVDDLESVHVEIEDRQLLAAALGLRHRHVEAVAEQGAVGQVGQQVVIELVLDQLFRLLALGDVPRHAVGADELFLVLLAEGVDADRTELDRHRARFEIAQVAAVLAAQAQLRAAGGAIAGAAFVEGVVGLVDVVLEDELGEVLAEDVFLLVAEQGFDAFVDEGEAAFLIQQVDHVRRVVDDELVQVLRLFEPLLDRLILLLQASPLQCVGDRAQQFVGGVGLAQEIVRAPAQRLGGMVEGGLAADHDDVAVDLQVIDMLHHLVTVHVGHVEIEQHEIEFAAGEQFNRFDAAVRQGGFVTGEAQDLLEAGACARLVVDDQDAGEKTALRRVYFNFLRYPAEDPFYSAPRRRIARVHD